MTDGRCPGCGNSSMFSAELGGAPKKSKAARFWLISIAVYLTASAALLVFVGHLLTEKLKAREAWNHAHPANSLPVERTASARHEGPVARVDELKGSGRIYLIQMGDHTAPYSLDDFAQWLRSKYALDVQVLPPMTVGPPDWDPSRKQVVAELLYQQIKREHPDLAANPKAFLFGVTDLNMFSVSNGWNYSFTQRYESRYAILSTYEGMRRYNWDRNREGADNAGKKFQARVRRILLRDVALLY